jgi:Kef-type K+ transport system membrane component KefB
MAAPFNVEVYSDALVVLGTAGIVVPLVRRSGLNPVLGYLGAGAASVSVSGRRQGPGRCDRVSAEGSRGLLW